MRSTPAKGDSAPQVGAHGGATRVSVPVGEAVSSAERGFDGTANEVATRPSGGLAHASGRDERGFERGAMIGRYVVLECLGAGGMGVVYLAYDSELDRRVALKLIQTPATTKDREERSLTQSLRARLLREAQALAKLSHPNVVTVYDVGTIDDGIFIAMAYLEGQTLNSWLKAQPRSWREVLPVVLAAGRGLAAAHAAGLVHRDFKPDNVVIDASGRAYVLDFGLVQASDESELSTASAPANDVVRTEVRSGSVSPTDRAATGVSPTATGSSYSGFSSSRLSDPLTEMGTVMGTPAYMAPEQYSARTDARTDQFAFCVTLFEALYGHRPFPGRDMKSRVEQIEAGPRFDVDDRRVPLRLRRILARGLHAQAQQRYPSLHELLAELGRDPWVLRRRWLGAAIAAVALAGATTGVHQLATVQLRQCSAGASAITELWNESRRSTIADAFAKLPDPFAPRAWSKAGDRLDAYVKDWQTMYAEACTATHETASQSESLLDLRMNCLQRRFDHVHSTLDVLDEPDDTTPKRVIDVVYKLPPIEYCGDAQALLSDVPPPEDPAVRREVDEFGRELASLEALQLTERHADALPQTEELLDRALQVDYGPLHADVRRFLIYALIRHGRAVEAEKHLALAVGEAERAGALAIAAGVELSAVWIKGYIGRDFVAAERHRQHADILIDAAGNPPTDRAFFHHISGGLAHGRGDNDNCITESTKAIELRRRHLDPNDPRITMSLNNLAVCVANPTPAGTDAALEILREVVERNRALFGDQHPSLALAMTNVGSEQLGGGRYGAAAPDLEAAMAMWEGLGQPDDSIAIATRQFLALAYFRLGETTRALSVSGVSLDGPATPVTDCPAGTRTPERAHLLASQYLQLGRIDDAEVVLRSGLEACEAALGKDHGDLLELRTVAARVALRRNDLALAERQLALALSDEAPTGTDIGRQHPAHVLLGRLHLERGQPNAAITQLESAREVGVNYFGSEHPKLSDVLRWTGRAHAATGNDEEAARMFTRALTVLEAAVGHSNPRMVELLLDTAELEANRGSAGAAASLLERANESFDIAENDPELQTRMRTLAVRLGTG